MVGLSIIIVNWNAGHQLRDCVLSVGRVSRVEFVLSEVIVVDNDSSDDSLERIDELGVPVTIIQNSENKGFAAACNEAVQRTSGTYLLFLNPDTRLFEDSLSGLVAFMEKPENSSVGICGVQLVDESGNECLSYAKFPCLRSYLSKAFGLDKLAAFAGFQVGEAGLEYGGARRVDQVIGAFFVTRRPLFIRLNGFDERFFVYFEEVDFSLRAHECGWISVYLPGVKCVHIGGGTSRQVRAARLFYSLRSRLLYGFKHFSFASASTLLVVTLIPELVNRLIFAIACGSLPGVTSTIGGYSMLIRDLRRILKVVFASTRIADERRKPS